MTVGDGLRLAVGTLTVLPVPPPGAVGRTEARTAMLLAPAVGLGIALPAAGLLALLDAADADPLVAAVLAVGLPALLTRGLHLDGLADVADGLASGRAAAGALEVMRRSDVGALGAATLVLVLLGQVAGLAAVQRAGVGWPVLVFAVVAGRVAIVLGCTSGVPAARPEGLGAAVAGSVPRAAAGAWVVGLLVAGTAAGALGTLGDGGGAAVAAVLALAVGLGSAALLLQRCVRRLGGVTGDVLGAACEVATTATLLAAALALTAA